MARLQESTKQLEQQRKIKVHCEINKAEQHGVCILKKK